MMRPLVLLVVALLGSSFCLEDDIEEYSVRVASDNTAVTAGSFPEVVNFEITGGPVATCAGSILADNMTITAASCFWNIITDTIVAASSVKICPSIDNTSPCVATAIDAQTITIHPNFRYIPVLKIFEYDVALVIPKTRINFDSNIAAINLGKKSGISNIDAHLQAATSIVGWGNIPDAANIAGQAGPNTAQWVNVTGLAHEECKRTYRYRNTPYFLPTSTICTKNAAGKGYCEGDQGAGLRYKSKIDNKNYLIGVASTLKSGRCPPDAPNLYTYVPPLGDWILSNGGPKQMNGGSGNGGGLLSILG